MTIGRPVAVTLALLALASLCLGADKTPAPKKEKIKPAAKPGATKVKLDIVLPKPLFIGTPKNLKSGNLEPARKGKLRAPHYAPKGTKLLSLRKPATSSDDDPIIGDLELVTDGDKEGRDGSYVELAGGKQYVQIDLGVKCEIEVVLLWHYHAQARVYRDVVVQVADDPDFIMNVRAIFNNDHDNSSGLGRGKDFEYIETYEGKLIDAGGIAARYVRIYSNGSTSGDENHYIEVEVFGRVPGK